MVPRRCHWGAHVPLVLVAFGCATSPAADPPPAQPLQTADLALQTADFVIYRGDSLVASERALHFPDRMEGTIEVPGRARVSYVARLDDRGLIERIETQIRPWQGEALANNDITVRFVGDSIFVDRSIPAATTRRYGGGRAVPYIHPSPALLEQVVMRALRMGGNPAAVRLWFVAQNGPIYARVSFVSARVADVEIQGSSFRVWLDEFGLLLAEVPSLGWLVQRRPR
jgi:hypothetical protein